jgi:hypothetical protein
VYAQRKLSLLQTSLFYPAHLTVTITTTPSGTYEALVPGSGPARIAVEDRNKNGGATAKHPQRLAIVAGQGIVL